MTSQRIGHDATDEAPPPPGATAGAGVPMPIRHTWSESDRFIPRTMVRPLQQVLANEAAGGAVMLVAAVAAIAWANSPWSAAYDTLWTTPLRVELGGLLHLDHLDLRLWVNDGLMTVFFLLVGAEIKREVVHGDLRDPRAVALPVMAALGGMIVPALIFVAFNAGSPGSEGWGIPMATDIAFAVGVVTLVGDRVPVAAKIFLLTLAVADDIGAIIVIAVFYTSDLSLGWFALALGGVAAAAALRRADVTALAPYLGVGAFAWLAMLESGVHATLVGVALGLLTPAWPMRSPRRFAPTARKLSDDVDRAYYDSVLTQSEFEENDLAISEVGRLALLSTSPLARLERGLSPWVSYLIVPLFAFANAGVSLSGDALTGIVDDPVTLGVTLGLLVGKTVGVLGACALAVRIGLGRLPEGASWRHLVGVAVCAGVGFTVALFVTGISFDDPALADAAKVGILAGSLASGVLGYLLLRATPPVAALVETVAATDGSAPAAAPSPALDPVRAGSGGAGHAPLA